MVTATLAVLCVSACLASIAVGAAAQEAITGPGFKPHQQDPTYELDFRPPPEHVEAAEIATRHGLFRAYQLPAPDGRPRSFFTVAFQARADAPGLRTLDEFVSVDLHTFKDRFPQGVIARVNIEGRIPAKLGRTGFPLAMFLFTGNERPGSSEGDALALFFATPGGFWSIVWTVPRPFIQQGFPVFFETFVETMTATPKPGAR